VTLEEAKKLTPGQRVVVRQDDGTERVWSVKWPPSQMPHGTWVGWFLERPGCYALERVLRVTDEPATVTIKPGRDLQLLILVAERLASSLAHCDGAEPPSESRWREIGVLIREARSRYEALDTNPARRQPVPTDAVESGWCAACRRESAWQYYSCLDCGKRGKGGAN
jgi:hypothetical protein